MIAAPDGERGPAVHRRRPARQLARRSSTGCTTARRCERDRRLARPRGQGPPLGQLPPARLAALPPALLGLPDPDRLLRARRHGARCPRTELPVDAARRRGLRAARAARRWPRPRTGSTRRARAAAARPGARPTRWTRSSTRPGTSCATATPHNDEAAVGPRDRRQLDAGRPVHRRRRARDPAPDVRALLRARRSPTWAYLDVAGAVRRAVHAGHDHPRRREDVQVARAT